MTHSLWLLGGLKVCFACFPGEQCQYLIYVEREVLCIVDSFTQALMLWFIAHYVFNLEYCSEVKEVVLCVQELLFKLPANCCKTSRQQHTLLLVQTFRTI